MNGSDSEKDLYFTYNYNNGQFPDEKENNIYYLMNKNNSDENNPRSTNENINLSDNSKNSNENKIKEYTKENKKRNINPMVSF